MFNASFGKSQNASFGGSPRADRKTTTPDGAPSPRGIKEVSQGIRVMARVRPFSHMELKATEGEEATSVIFMKDNTVTVLDPADSYAPKESFVFDEVFWSIPESQNQYAMKPFASQEDVFKAAGLPTVQDIITGFNCCIFAYGQTGSGKTYTMLGNENDVGLSPRILHSLFEQLSNYSSDMEPSQFVVEVSFFEIYNERVRDLLAGHVEAHPGAPIVIKRSGSHVPKPELYHECKVRNHPETGTFVEGLKREAVDSAVNCLKVLNYGMAHRSTAATKLNEVSSRSHAVLQVLVKQKFPISGTQRTSVLNLVDLAGSERIRRSGVTGQALVEAKTINQSLSTLRRVIDVLIENETIPAGRNKGVPPFRESMLTWVLSDSLGGNSKTTMLAAVSPHLSNLDDSVASLRYALKAKSITCNVKVNEEKTAVVISALKNQIEELKRKRAMTTKDMSHEAIRNAKEAKEELARREADYHKAVSDQTYLEALGKDLRKEIEEKKVALSALAPALEEKLRHAEQLKELQVEFDAKMGSAVLNQEQIETSQAARKEAEKDILLGAHAAIHQEKQFKAREASSADALRVQDAAKQEQYANFFRHVCAVVRTTRAQRALEGNILVERGKLQELTAQLEVDYIKSWKDARDDLLTDLREIEDKNLECLRTHEKCMAENTEKISTLTNGNEEAEESLYLVQERITVVREDWSRISATREAVTRERTVEIMALQKEYDSLSVQSAEREMAAQRLLQELTRLQKKHATLEAEIHNSEASRIENELKEKDAAIANLLRLNEDVEEELEFIRRAVKDTDKGIESAKMRVAAMKQEATGAGQNRSDLRMYVKEKLHPQRDPSGAPRHPGVTPRTGSPRLYGTRDSGATSRRSARRAEFADDLQRRGFA